MPKTEAGGHRIESIDMLRGVAALMVVWWHVFDPVVRYLADDRLQAVAKSTALHGGSGVYMFFAISGFIIPLAGVAGGKRILFWPALAKRMARLYPPFAASLLFAVLVLLAAQFVPGFAGKAQRYPLSVLALNATYLAPFFDTKWLNPVYWTLLIELQFYVAIYLVLINIHRIRPTTLLVATNVVALLPLALTSFTLIADFTDCFAVGFVAFLVRDRRVSATAGMLAAILPLVVVTVDKGVVVTLLVAATSAICLVGLRPWRVLVWLGTISYSLYLTHYFVGTKAFRLTLRFVPAGDGGVLIAYAVAIAVCLAVAAVFYHLAERPAMAWSGRINARPRGTAAASVPAPIPIVENSTLPPLDAPQHGGKAKPTDAR